MRPHSIFLAAVLCLFGSACFAQHDIPPDDSKAFEILIVGEKNVSPATWFASNSGLAKLAERVKFVVMPPGDPLYQQRYASIISGDPPLILFQRAGGGVVYAADKNTIPSSADGLYAELKHHYELAQKAVQPRPVIRLQLINDSVEDCPDGTCTPTEVDKPVRWRPLQNLDPFHDVKRPVENWFSDTTQSVMWAIGLTIILGVLFIASIVALALLYFLTRFIR